MSIKVLTNALCSQYYVEIVYSSITPCVAAGDAPPVAFGFPSGIAFRSKATGQSLPYEIAERGDDKEPDDLRPKRLGKPLQDRPTSRANCRTRR